MPKPQDCPDQSWIARLIDGNLTSEQEAKLTRHLDTCIVCQDKLEQHNRSELLGDLGNSRMDPIGESMAPRPEALDSKLAEIRSNRPRPSLAFSSGYADILPWLADAKPNIGRIREFELTRFIGRGGMGVVFEANDTKLERAVAIKLMSPGLLVDPSASERFLREARTAAKINHVNVVTVHAVDEIRGLPYLVMELIRGHSLEQQLARQAMPPTIEVLKIARQTALGLAAAHESGITHRDIKPSNLMFDRKSKRMRIADFGLASTINDTSLTRSGVLVGTPDFASPEQVQGQPVDARSDLFSLGCVLFLLCAGKPPFASVSLIETLDAVCRAEPDLTQLNDQAVPPELIEIITRLLQKEPAGRFQTATELCQSLERVSVSARTKEPLARDEANEQGHSTPWSKLRIGYVAIGVLILLVAVALWWTKPWNDTRSTQQQQPSPVNREIVSDDESASSKAAVDSGERSVVNNNDSAPTTIHVESTDEVLEAFEQSGDLVLKMVPGQIYNLNQPIYIQSRSVRFEGDANQMPILQFGSDIDDAAIYSENSELVFSGVKIRDGSDVNSDESLIFCDAGKLELENCILVSESREPVMEIHEANLVLKSTALVSENTCFSLIPSVDQQIQIVDSVIVAPIGFHVEHGPRFDLNAKGSCFAGWSGFEIETEELTQISIKFEIEECEFHFPDAMFLLLNSDIEEADFDEREVAEDVSNRFRWLGSDSLVPNNLIGFQADEDEKHFSWEECNVPLSEQMRHAPILDAPPIEWLIQRCSSTRVNSAYQVRKLLTE